MTITTHSSARLILAVTAFAGVASTSLDVFAADPATAPAKPGAASTTAARIEDPSAPPSAAQPQPDVVQKSDSDDDRKHFSVELNPLALAIGRYSVQGEYLPLPHHAITLNPFYTHAPVKVNDVDMGSLNGFGGELGYRFYTGSKGPNGFYVGPSLIFASYSQSASEIATGVPGATVSTGSTSFTQYGAALDIGGQAVIGPGIVVGGGFGLQYTKNSTDLNTDNLNLASSIIAGGGFRPRFLVSAGYAF